MKKIKLTDEQAKSVFKSTTDEGVKQMLIANYGKEFFAERPLGVWCLTNDGRAIAPKDWEDNPFENTYCIGIGVVSKDTEYIVSLAPTAVLPLGNPDVTGYDEIAYDETTYNNKAVTDAVEDAQRRQNGSKVVYSYGDNRFPFKGCPAIEHCRKDKFKYGHWTLPTLATLKDLQVRVKEINEALLAVDAPMLTAGWYRSSTIKKSDKRAAFVVNLGNGNVYRDYVNCGHNVRAVSAFQIKDFRF